MINYTEKGEGLHRAIADAGHWLYRKDGVWLASDDAAVQAIIDGFDGSAGKWEAIKAERDRRSLTGGYQAGGKWFHSDLFSRSQQMGLVMLGANIPPGLLWKTMDGSFVEMTPTLAQQVFAAAAQSDATLFAVAEAKRAAMAGSQTPWDYDVLAGWPVAFGE